MRVEAPNRYTIKMAGAKQKRQSHGTSVRQTSRQADKGAHGELVNKEDTFPKKYDAIEFGTGPLDIKELVIEHISWLASHNEKNETKLPSGPIDTDLIAVKKLPKKKVKKGGR